MSVGVAQLRAFVTVVNTGGFGSAAAALGISQSAVSHAVSALERSVGRPVLLRGAGGRPTPTLFGERILDHARSALASVSAIGALADAETDRPGGTVSVAAIQTACHALLPGMLARWRAEFPDVLVSLFEGEDEEMERWLASAGVDLAVLVNPPTSVGGVVIGRDEFHAVLRADHPLAGQPVVDLAELRDDEFLLSTGGCEPYVQQAFRLAGEPLRARHQVRQISTLFDMVRAGVGVTIVPRMAEGLEGPGLRLVPLVQRVPRTLVLAGPSTRPWHPVARALVESLEPA
jgi:DNA-binding transcriptional LysR family regulator